MGLWLVTNPGKTGNPGERAVEVGQSGFSYPTSHAAPSLRSAILCHLFQRRWFFGGT